MTDAEIRSVVRATLKEIKYSPMTTYGKTEVLLYSYKGCKDSMAMKRLAKNEDVRRSIASTQSYIELVDIALKSIEDDRYYCIITLYYFDGKTIEDIAGILDKSTKTIFKQKKRLVNMLKNVIFADEVLKEILEK